MMYASEFDAISQNVLTARTGSSAQLRSNFLLLRWENTIWCLQWVPSCLRSGNLVASGGTSSCLWLWRNAVLQQTHLLCNRCFIHAHQSICHFSAHLFAHCVAACKPHLLMLLCTTSWHTAVRLNATAHAASRPCRARQITNIAEEAALCLV